VTGRRGSLRSAAGGRLGVEPHARDRIVRLSTDHAPRCEEDHSLEVPLEDVDSGGHGRPGRVANDGTGGDASGVLNAVQQLAGAIGVAGIGTLFFSTLGHSGFVTALSHSLVVELASTPVLLVLISLLPPRARESDVAGEAAGRDQADGWAPTPSRSSSVSTEPIRGTNRNENLAVDASTVS
jgi:hypothetical protein